jgi:hypothetical protein
VTDTVRGHDDASVFYNYYYYSFTFSCFAIKCKFPIIPQVSVNVVYT